MLAEQGARPDSDGKMACGSGKLPACADGPGGGGALCRGPVHVQGSADWHRDTPHSAHRHGQCCAIRLGPLHRAHRKAHRADRSARVGDLRRCDGNPETVVSLLPSLLASERCIWGLLDAIVLLCVHVTGATFTVDPSAPGLLTFSSGAQVRYPGMSQQCLLVCHERCLLVCLLTASTALHLTEERCPSCR